MEIRNAEVYNASEALAQLAHVRCDAKTALKLARMTRSIGQLRADLDTARNRLIKQAAPDAAEGEPVTVTPEMAAEWHGLMDTETEYAGPTLAEGDIERLGEVTPQALMWLSPLIVE